MRKSLLAIVALLSSALGAQQPLASAAVDLQQLVQRLAVDGPVPAVVDAIPEQVLAEGRDVLALLEPEEQAQMLRWHLGSLRVLGLLAVGVLQQVGDEPSSASLLAEIRACAVLGGLGASRLMNESVLQRSGGWPTRILPLVRARGRDLVARYLRKNDDGPELGEVLGLGGRFVDADLRETLQMAILQQGSSHGSVQAILRRFDASFYLQRFEDAAVELQRLATAERPPFVETAASVSVSEEKRRRKLEEVRRSLPAVAEPGTAGELARLRVLQLCDSDRAVTLATRLLADGVAHALPHAVLAVHAHTENQPRRADRHLEQALELPGQDFACVTLAMIMRVLPVMQRAGSEVDPERLKKAFERSLAQFDLLVAPLDSDDAVLFREMRALDWPYAGREMMQSLSTIAAIAADLPDLPDAQNLLLTSILMYRDAAAARLALAAAPRDVARRLPEHALQRASCAVSLFLNGDEKAEPLARLLLTELADAQRDPRDAAYLRGVMLWFQATRLGGRRELVEQAAAQFELARRLPFERGAWAVHCGRVMTSALLGNPQLVDDRQQQRALKLSDQPPEPHRSVPLLLARLLSRPDAHDFEAAQLFAGLVEAPAWSAAIWTAVAMAHERQGDADAARIAAKKALASLATADQQNGRRTERGNGVLRLSEFQWQMGFEGGIGRVRCRSSSDLLICPRLAGRARLKRLAREH